MKHEPITLQGIDGEYRDEYNTMIIGKCKTCHIVIYGCNNYVNFHNANLHNTSVFLGANTLEVGENTVFTDSAIFFKEGNTD